MTFGSRRVASRRGLTRVYKILTVVVAVVVIVVASQAILYLAVLHAVDHNPGGPGPTSIYPALKFGQANLVTGPTNSTLSGQGCGFGDFCYRITLSASTVTFGDVLLRVVSPANSTAVLPNALGFAVLNLTGGVVAYDLVSDGVLETTQWTYPVGSVSPDTPLSTIYQFSIDMGSRSPEGGGYSLYGVGTEYYSGATAALTLS